MKEKISNERREQLLKLNRFRRQMACLIKGILDKNQCSDEFTNLKPEDQFFNDSCTFVNLRYELNGLMDTLDKMAKYEDALLTDYYE